MTVPIKLKTIVRAKEHANLDSLPLRYGVHYEEDMWIDIKRLGEYSVQKDGRLKFEGIFEDPLTGETHYGFFVVVLENNNYVLVTVMNKDIKTEYFLSETMINLRKKKKITPEWLLSKHELYKSGQLNTSADLVDALADTYSEEEIAKIKAQNEKDLKKKDEELKQQKKVIAIKSDENKTLKTENLLLQKEVDLLKAANEKSKREVLEESKVPQLAEKVTTAWYSKTGSSYKNCGMLAPILDVQRDGNNIVLTTLNRQGERAIIRDFGRYGFVAEVFNYLQKCKEMNRRGVYLITWRADVSNPEIKLASDTMMLPQYRDLWRE